MSRDSTALHIIPFNGCLFLPLLRSPLEIDLSELSVNACVVINLVLARHALVSISTAHTMQ